MMLSMTAKGKVISNQIDSRDNCNKYLLDVYILRAIWSQIVIIPLHSALDQSIQTNQKPVHTNNDQSTCYQRSRSCRMFHRNYDSSNQGHHIRVVSTVEGFYPILSNRMKPTLNAQGTTVSMYPRTSGIFFLFTIYMPFVPQY